MRKFGLIGYPLGHSFSAEYFKNKFIADGVSAEYDNYPIEDVYGLKDLLASVPELEGLNVTIPYKVAVTDMIDVQSLAVERIGAVNVIKITALGEDRLLSGYNTDYAAFRDTIAPLMQSHHQHALVLGTGGAARAVRFAFETMGIDCVMVARGGNRKFEGAISYRDINMDLMARAKIIVNCTPVGMHPAEDAAPDIPYSFLTKDHLLYDLIYNPKETKFLRYGKKFGAQTKNGLEMLYRQAELSWKIWNTSTLL